MALVTAKPLRRLGELLQEKQEPFVVEVYLLERRFAKKIVAVAAQERLVDAQGNSHSDKGCDRSDSDTLKRRSLAQYFKILKVVLKFLSINKIKTKTSLCKNEELSNSATAKVHDAETFNSCCESNAKKPAKILKNDQRSATAEANRAPKEHNYGVSEGIEDVQEKSPNGSDHFHHQVVSTEEDSKLRKVKTNIQQSQHSHRHDSISKPEKITEDMILSASLSYMLLQSVEQRGFPEPRDSHFSQMLRSTGILQQKQQLLFDFVREISTNIPCSYDKQQQNVEMLGHEEVGKLIFEKLEQWGNQEGDETNINRLLKADYHNSINAWTDFETQDIAIVIGDTIFEDIRNEIVSEIIHILV